MGEAPPSSLAAMEASCPSGTAASEELSASDIAAPGGEGKQSVPTSWPDALFCNFSQTLERHRGAPLQATPRRGGAATAHNHVSTHTHCDYAAVGRPARAKSPRSGTAATRRSAWRIAAPGGNLPQGGRCEVPPAAGRSARLHSQVMSCILQATGCAKMVGTK